MSRLTTTSRVKCNNECSNRYLPLSWFMAKKTRPRQSEFYTYVSTTCHIFGKSTPELQFHRIEHFVTIRIKVTSYNINHITKHFPIIKHSVKNQKATILNKTKHISPPHTKHPSIISIQWIHTYELNPILTTMWLNLLIQFT